MPATKVNLQYYEAALELVALRKRAGFETREELGERLSISTNSWGKIEQGKRTIPKRVLKEFCYLCGVSTDQIPKILIRRKIAMMQVDPKYSTPSSK